MSETNENSQSPKNPYAFFLLVQLSLLATFTIFTFFSFGTINTQREKVVAKDKEISTKNEEISTKNDQLNKEKDVRLALQAISNLYIDYLEEISLKFGSTNDKDSSLSTNSNLNKQNEDSIDPNDFSNLLFGDINKSYLKTLFGNELIASYMHNEFLEVVEKKTDWQSKESAIERKELLVRMIDESIKNSKQSLKELKKKIKEDYPSQKKKLNDIGNTVEKNVHKLYEDIYKDFLNILDDQHFDKNFGTSDGIFEFPLEQKDEKKVIEGIEKVFKKERSDFDQVGNFSIKLKMPSKKMLLVEESQASKTDGETITKTHIVFLREKKMFIVSIEAYREYFEHEIEIRIKSQIEDRIEELNEFFEKVKIYDLLMNKEKLKLEIGLEKVINGEVEENEKDFTIVSEIKSTIRNIRDNFEEEKLKLEEEKLKLEEEVLTLAITVKELEEKTAKLEEKAVVANKDSLNMFYAKIREIRSNLNNLKQNLLQEEQDQNIEEFLNKIEFWNGIQLHEEPTIQKIQLSLMSSIANSFYNLDVLKENGESKIMDNPKGIKYISGISSCLFLQWIQMVQKSALEKEYQEDTKRLIKSIIYMWNNVIAGDFTDIEKYRDESQRLAKEILPILEDEESIANLKTTLEIE